jgi:DNA anti-recombination protein RmuC
LAFWASVFGVGTALLIKLRYYFFGITESLNTAEEDLYAGEKIAQSLKGIHWSLAGDDETTLVSQTKLMRQDMNDRLDALKKAQTESLKLLSDMGSKALIEALNDVIREFNVQLQEQFGENFKQLNESVGKLLVWQEQYKSHVENTEERHKSIVGAMQTSTEHYSKLVNDAGSFTKTASDLGTLLIALNQEKQTLTQSLTALASMLESVKLSIPQTEEKILQFAKAVSDSAIESHTSLKNSMAENAAKMKRAIEASGEGIARQQEEQTKRIGDMTAKMKEQAAVLEKTLESELQKSLESLGRQLTALSAKFAEDYTPLTERLREIVRIAGRVG